MLFVLHALWTYTCTTARDLGNEAQITLRKHRPPTSTGWTTGLGSLFNIKRSSCNIAIQCILHDRSNGEL